MSLTPFEMSAKGAQTRKKEALFLDNTIGGGEGGWEGVRHLKRASVNISKSVDAREEEEKQKRQKLLIFYLHKTDRFTTQ